MWRNVRAPDIDIDTELSLQANESCRYVKGKTMESRMQRRKQRKGREMRINSVWRVLGVYVCLRAYADIECAVVAGNLLHKLSAGHDSAEVHRLLLRDSQARLKRYNSKAASTGAAYFARVASRLAMHLENVC